MEVVNARARNDRGERGEHDFGEGAEVGWCGADSRSLLTAVQHTDRQLCAAPSPQSPHSCDGGDGCSDHTCDAGQARCDGSRGDYWIVINGVVNGLPAFHLPLNDSLVPSIPPTHQAHVASLSDDADRQLWRAFTTFELQRCASPDLDVSTAANLR